MLISPVRICAIFILLSTIFLVMERSAAGLSASSYIKVDQSDAIAQNTVETDSSVTIFTPKGSRVVAHFQVAIANTPQKQQLGLMHVHHLKDTVGMLFIFTPAKPASFWMKNTVIPLDIIFIDENNIIFKIESMAQPLSTRIISSIKPTHAVLEIGGGLAYKMGITRGQLVESSFLPLPPLKKVNNGHYF